MKKRLFFLSLSLVFLFLAGWTEKWQLRAAEKAILYYGEGCPHCAQVHQFLADHQLSIEIEEKEIYRHPENAQEFNRLCDEKNIDLMRRGVPFLYAQGKCFIGDREIINFLKNYQSSQKKEEGRVLGAEEKEKKRELTIPLLLGAAAADSINPCAFAVLFILMTTLLASGAKERALFSGLAYSASIFISYFLMGLGLYSVISNFKASFFLTKGIGILAIILGLFNLKDYFWYGKVFLMEVPLSWRPRLKKLVRSMTNPLSAFLIGFAVSLFLLPCTSGPYLVVVGMLGNKETYSRAVALLLLYNFVFVLPMILITLGVYRGLDVKKAEKTRQQKLRLLHLIAGAVMLIMGIILLTGSSY